MSAATNTIDGMIRACAPDQGADIPSLVGLSVRLGVLKQVREAVVKAEAGATRSVLAAYNTGYSDGYDDACEDYLADDGGYW